MASDTHTFAVRPQTPNRRLRNQSSLERLLSFTLLSPPPIPAAVHDDCKRAHAVISPRGKAGNSDGADSEEIETGTGYREGDGEFKDNSKLSTTTKTRRPRAKMKTKTKTKTMVLFTSISFFALSIDIAPPMTGVPTSYGWCSTGSSPQHLRRMLVLPATQPAL